MKSVPRSEIADYLYCINLHCRELLIDANNKELPKEMRDEADTRCRELYELKEQVLLKLVAEGLATVRKKLHRICNRDYYCIRLVRESTFHIKKDSHAREALRNSCGRI